MHLIFALSAVYFIAWLWLLRRWIENKDPYPILGRGWKTRAFWGVTFLFFNPLLSLLYLFFGVLPKNAAPPARQLNAVRILGLTLTALTLLILEAPIGVPRAKPQCWTQPAPRAGHAEITILGNSDAAVSTSGSSGWYGYHRFDPSHVAVITHGDHPFLTHLGHAVAAHFSSIPSVKSVRFHPNSKACSEAAFMPSLFIELREKSIHELPLPAGLLLDADIEISIKSSLYSTSRWTTLPLAGIFASASIREKFSTFGAASPAAKYDRIATTFLNTAGLSLGTFIYPWWQFEPLPPIPDYMYGKGGRVPEQIIPGTAPELHLSGGHMLVHDMALWEFAQGEDLARLQSRFKEEGWSTQKYSSGYLRMVRSSEQLIFKTENAPLEVCWIYAFSDEEVDQALERLLTDPDVGTDTLLFFGSYFRQSKREDLFQAYHARLESVDPSSFPIAFERARVHHHAEEPEQAKVMLTAAHAHEQLLTTPQGGWDLHDLANQIGLDFSDEKTIDLSRTYSLAVNSEEIVQETPANDPFRFHVAGEADNQPTRCFTARLTDLMWPMTPTAGGIQYNSEPLKVITVTGKSDEQGITLLFSVCAERDGLLAKQNINLSPANLAAWTLSAAETESGGIEWHLAPAH